MAHTSISGETRLLAPGNVLGSVRIDLFHTRVKTSTSLALVYQNTSNIAFEPLVLNDNALLLRVRRLWRPMCLLPGTF